MNKINFNDETPRSDFNITDRISYYTVARGLDFPTYQTENSCPYDFYSEDIIGEIKVRTIKWHNSMYPDLEISFTKVSEMVNLRYINEKAGKNYKYLFYCPICDEKFGDVCYVTDLDTVLDCCISVEVRNNTTCGKPTQIKKWEYRIPLYRWRKIPMKTNDYIENVQKAGDKYNVDCSQAIDRLKHKY